MRVQFIGETTYMPYYVSSWDGIRDCSWFIHHGDIWNIEINWFPVKPHYKVGLYGPRGWTEIPYDNKTALLDNWKIY